MAKIALKDGVYVILNDGLIRCECCACYGGFNPGDVNVFNISKDEYYKYFYGGIWELEAKIKIDYTISNDVATENITGESILRGQTISVQDPEAGTGVGGCSYGFAVFGTMDVKQEITLKEPPFQKTEQTYRGIPTDCFFSYDLKRIKTNYYIALDGGAGAAGFSVDPPGFSLIPTGIDSDFRGSENNDTGNPSSSSMEIDGNFISHHSTGLDFGNESNIELKVTFTPIEPA